MLKWKTLILIVAKFELIKEKELKIVLCHFLMHLKKYWCFLLILKKIREAFIYLSLTENRHLLLEGSEKFWLIMRLKPACNNQSPHISCGIFCLLGLKSKG